jgi:hypothetical protein
MADDIFIIQNDGELVEMSEHAYDSEDLLQELLADYPKLLAGGQMNTSSPRRWLLIKREKRIPSTQHGGGRWSVDHLFLDQDAIPTLVEVKRSTDTRIRREVIGQMLDYAANAVMYWPAEKIRAEFEAGSDDADEKLDELLEGDSDPEEFWEKVGTNLKVGRIRMVFVADAIPPELRRIVEFLNEQMGPAEVLAVEIKQFVGKGMQTLVPRVVGQTSRKKPQGGSHVVNETRMAFWRAFCEMAAKQAPDIGSVNPTDGAKIEFTPNDDDFCIISRAEIKSAKLSVVLRLQGDAAAEQWAMLNQYFTKPDASLQKHWLCVHGKLGKGFLVRTEHKLDLDSPETWAEQHQWILGAVRDIHDVLLPLIKNMPAGE